MKVCKKHMKLFEYNDPTPRELSLAKYCDIHKLFKYYKTHGYTKDELKGSELRGSM